MCCSWDAFVDEESIVRIIDAFVEHLDIKKYGLKQWLQKDVHHTIPKAFINSIFMEAEKESVLHENWQRVAK